MVLVCSFCSECNLFASDRFAICPAGFPVHLSLDGLLVLNHDLLQSSGHVLRDLLVGFIGKDIQTYGDHTCLTEVIGVDVLQILEIFLRLLVLVLHVFQ